MSAPTRSRFNIRLYKTILKLNQREPQKLLSQDEQIESLITLISALDHVISTVPLQLGRPTEQLEAILGICCDQIEVLFERRDQTMEFVRLIVELLKRIVETQAQFSVQISESSITELMDSMLKIQEYSRDVYAQIIVVFNPFSLYSFDPSLILLSLVTLLNKWTEELLKNPNTELIRVVLERKIHLLNEMLPESVLYFAEKNITPGFLPILLHEINLLLKQYSNLSGDRLIDQNLNALNLIKSFLDFLVWKEGNQLWQSFTLIETINGVFADSESKGKFTPLVRLLAARGLEPPQHLSSALSMRAHAQTARSRNSTEHFEEGNSLILWGFLGICIVIFACVIANLLDRFLRNFVM